VQLAAVGDGEAEIIRVAVPGDPTVGQGEMVAVDRLTAQAWELDGRSGMAFRCAAQDLRHPRRPDPRPLVQHRRRTGSSGSSIEPVGDRQ
jgi:hypothetical protein